MVNKKRENVSVHSLLLRLLAFFGQLELSRRGRVSSFAIVSLPLRVRTNSSRQKSDLSSDRSVATLFWMSCRCYCDSEAPRFAERRSSAGGRVFEVNVRSSRLSSDAKIIVCQHPSVLHEAWSRPNPSMSSLMPRFCNELLGPVNKHEQSCKDISKLYKQNMYKS